MLGKIMWELRIWKFIPEIIPLTSIPLSMVPSFKITSVTQFTRDL